MSLQHIARSFDTRRENILRAASWTALLTATVAVASLAPEIAFVAAISPSSRPNCKGNGMVRIPVSHDPTEVFCFPVRMVRRSAVDFFVPAVFAALIVTASAVVVRSCASH